MESEYEIFASLSDGSIELRGHVSGLRNTRSKLLELLLFTGKEHFAIAPSTREIVFSADVSKVRPERGDRRIFQIAYTDQLRFATAKSLRSLGYGVLSAVSNGAAKILLTTIRQENHDIGLFLVGNGSSFQTRREMVEWLKENFPRVRILVLNPPNQRIPDPEGNLEQCGPDGWMRLVSSAFSSYQDHAQLV